MSDNQPRKQPRNASVDRAFEIIDFDFSKFDDKLLKELEQRIQDELLKRGIFEIDFSKLDDEALGKMYRRIKEELAKRGFLV